MTEKEDNQDINTEVTDESEGQQLNTEEVNTDNDEKGASDNKIVKFIKSIIPTLVIAIGSFLLVFLLHFLDNNYAKTSNTRRNWNLFTIKKQKILFLSFLQEKIIFLLWSSLAS